MRLCRENLAKFHDDFWRLCDTSTDDKTWIYHRQMDHKSTNTRWVIEGKSPTTVARRGRFEPKTLFSIFFR